MDRTYNSLKLVAWLNIYYLCNVSNLTYPLLNEQKNLADKDVQWIEGIKDL